MITTSDNISAIEAVEKAMGKATPGPWEWRKQRGLSHFDVLSGNCQDVLSAEEYAGASWIEISADDAAYIAACNPVAMSAILAEVRKAEALKREIADLRNALRKLLRTAEYELYDASHALGVYEARALLSKESADAK